MYKIFVPGVLLLIFLVPLLSNASPPPPSPTCSIVGTIESVQYKGAWSHSCLESKRPSCPTDVSLRHSEHYALRLHIESSTYLSGKTNYTTCDHIIGISGFVDFVLSTSSVPEGKIPKVGGRVEGVINSVYVPRISELVFIDTEEGTAAELEVESAGFGQTGQSEDESFEVKILILALLVLLAAIILFFIKSKEENYEV